MSMDRTELRTPLLKQPHLDSSFSSFAVAYEECKSPLTEVKVEIQNKPITIKEKKEIKLNKEKKLTLDSILQTSKIASDDPEEQAQNLLKEFNKKIRQSSISTSSVRGVRIPPGYFLLVSRNNVPEIALSSEDYLTLPLVTSPGITVKQLGIFQLTTPYTNGGRSHIVNVPQGKIAKAWSGNQPILLREGPHVIHDETFKFNPQEDFVDIASPYISHGNIHILRVPKGKIAKIWNGTEPQLLESSPEPYIFNSPFFRLKQVNNEQLFEDAAQKLIIHGSLKRLMPETGEVAVTYDNGTLKIIESTKDNKPIMIESQSHRVAGFLNVTVQTQVFPSETTKEKRREETKNQEEIVYEIFTTKESLKVGVKLLVAYRITNPALALSLLGRIEDINKHIENIATVDMGKVIQQCSSQEFLSSTQTKPKRSIENKEEKNSQRPSAPELLTFQDEVRDKLSHDLHEYGIELVRLNIETPKILDEKIANEMAKQALLTAAANAKEAVMDKNSNLAKSEADQKAAVEYIAQKQHNANLLAEGDAKLELAKKEALATIEKAKGDAEAIRIRNEAEFAYLERKAKLLASSPELLELEKARILSEPLRNSTLSITSAELRGLLSQGLFSTLNTNTIKTVSQPEQKQESAQRPSSTTS